MSEEKKTTPCPVCQGKLKKGEKMVYCENYKPKKDGKDWYNEGSCDFHIPFNQKVFGKTLSPADIKRLLAGEILRNSKGDMMSLDLSSDFFTAIEFAPRKEDKDF